MLTIFGIKKALSLPTNNVLSNNWRENLFLFPNFVDFRKIKYKGTKCPSFANSLFYEEKKYFDCAITFNWKSQQKRNCKSFVHNSDWMLDTKKHSKVYIY